MIRNFNYIFIGSINRSGGSLLARLFDGHEQVASYPLELPFPHNNFFYEICDNFAGIPMSVPIYEKKQLNFESKFLYPGNYSRSLIPKKMNEYSFDKLDLLDVPKSKPKIKITWGKERSDPIGVRKNYLEKSFYDVVKTEFNYENFIKNLTTNVNQDTSWVEAHNLRHLAFFENWDNGRHINKNTTHIVCHDSGGLYLTNLQDYFKIYKNSRFIVPVRDVLGYIASEKVRLARIFFGARRFNKPKLPFFLIKKFKGYDLKAKVRNWSTALTRTYLLQQKFGKTKNFLVYSNENLILNTEKVMRSFSKNINIKYDEILCEPTIGGNLWSGNSHYGKSKGINTSTLYNYNKVLDKEEIDFINENVGDLNSQILSQKNSFLDLTDLEEKLFNDIFYQKKYFDNIDKITLYYSLVNNAGRKINVQKVSKLSIIALIFSAYAYILNIPRILKLRFFPGFGKQNYT